MTINTSGDLILSFFGSIERERERKNPKPSMQGEKLLCYRPGIQSGRGLGGVLRGMGKIASAALRGDVGPVLKSIARKTLINYGKNSKTFE